MCFTKNVLQIMRLYEDIIRERSAKGPDYLNALLEVERKRDYRVREETLRADIEMLQARIAGIRRDFYPIKEEVSQSVRGPFYISPFRRLV